MNYTEIRLKIRHFLKKYKKIIFIVLIVWCTIFIINKYLENRDISREPSTTYEPHTSIMDTSSSTPQNLQKTIEELIEEYVSVCNDGNYQKAFNMLSDDCKKYSFDDNVQNFMLHVLEKMPTPKKYGIQSYSNIEIGNKKVYIYEIKYIDDLMATGLTNSTYAFTSEKITFYRNDNNEYEMNVGDFIYHYDIKNISENEYLKIDVKDKIVDYSTETYSLTITNRSNYTVVIADGVETDEVVLQLPNEVRKREEVLDIILNPQESLDLTMTFPKFVDDGDVASKLVFASVRVMEKYSGTENVDEATIQSEIDNAISKFSMEVNVE